VSLSASTSSPVNFDVYTINGTAFGGGNDYVDVPNPTGLSIPAGQTSVNVQVQVKPDTNVESNETFTLNLNNVVGATVLKGQGMGTIVNDDDAKLSIADTSIAEGNSGFSTLSFAVTLSQPMPTPVTFTVTTGNTTASAGSDYEAATKSMLIDAGRTRIRFEVKVFGDATAEPDETFKATLSGVTGASILDGVATATISNDDAAALTISQIQGIAIQSPVVEQNVSTEGVVTALTADGFFIQSADADQDGDARSSEGLFVRGLAGASVAIGDRVQVAGRVTEALVGAGSEQLTQTEMLAAKVDTLASGQALPKPVAIDANTFASNPGIASYERFEGMRTAIAELTVVAPSGGRVDEASGRVSGDGRFYGVAAGIARPFLEPGLSVLSSARAAGVSPQVFDANPERLRIDALGQRGAQLLSADAGDSVRGLVGVLGYGDGAYRLLPDPSAAIHVAAKSSPKPVTAAVAGEATIANFPLRRFLDDRRDGSEPVLASSAYATRLAKTANAICRYARNPDILALSGLENAAVLRDVAAATNGRDGNVLFADSCNGNVAYAASVPAAAKGQAGFLVDTSAVRPGVARVEVLSVTELGAAARFRQRDGSNEALHVQAPVLLQARINQANGGSHVVTVLNAQLSALEGDLDARGSHGWATRGDYLRARRAAQARAIAQLVRQRQLAQPNESLVVLGDFEAAQFNDGRSDLMGVLGGRTAPRAQVLGYEASPLVQGLSNLTTRLPAAQRYTVVREGNAQAVDHILVNPALLQASPAARVEVARINADFGEDNYADAGVPVRVSDHDPMVLYLDLR
jgi:uncharacterized protein